MPKRTRPKNPAPTTNAPRAPRTPIAANDGSASDIAAVHARICQMLGISTLEDRHRDMLDFHSVGVATLREIIQIAFDAGAGVAAVSAAAHGTTRTTRNRK